MFSSKFNFSKTKQLTIETYSGSVFYGANGDKWTLVSDPPSQFEPGGINLSLGFVGICWATNSNWSDLTIGEAILDYSSENWTSGFNGGDYVFDINGSSSLLLRDDGYGLNFIGYTDAINDMLASHQLGFIKLMITNGSYGIFKLSGMALVPGFRARLVLQEQTNDITGEYLSEYSHYIFEFQNNEQQISLLDDLYPTEAKYTPNLEYFLTDPYNYGWSEIVSTPYEMNAF